MRRAVARGGGQQPPPSPAWITAAQWCNSKLLLLAHKHPDFSVWQSKTCLEQGCGLFGFLTITIGFFKIRIIIMHRNLL